jgi:energy-converting hydrogenase Eha subunit F
MHTYISVFLSVINEMNKQIKVLQLNICAVLAFYVIHNVYNEQIYINSLKKCFNQTNVHEKTKPYAKSGKSLLLSRKYFLIHCLWN